MRINIKTLTHAILCFAILLTVMLVFIRLNYIDWSVVQIVYLPIFVIIVLGMVLRHYYFGYIFTIAAGIGLLAEYAVHVNMVNPTMSGAFLNTMIVIAGFIIGTIVQVIMAKYRLQE